MSELKSKSKKMAYRSQDDLLMRFGRNLNTDTMMYEFSDKIGLSIPAELIPTEGDNIDKLFQVKDRIEHGD